MEEKLVKKTISKQGASKSASKTSSKGAPKKSAPVAKVAKNPANKSSKPAGKPNNAKQEKKPVVKKEVKKKVSFTIFELRDKGAKLFESENQKFNAIVNVVSRELRKDNYGIAHDFAESNLRREEFDGYEQGCLGSICGCITAYLVELHIQQGIESKAGTTI